MQIQTEQNGELTQQLNHTAQQPRPQEHQTPVLSEGIVLVQDIVTGNQIALLPSNCW